MSRGSRALVVLAVGLAAVTLAGCGGGREVDPALSPEARAGLEVTRALGCVSCHGEAGQGVEGLGPPIVGLIGSEATLTDGRVVVIDSDYLARALLVPEADLTVVWSVPMPAFDPSSEDLRAILAYMTEAG